MNRVGLFCNFKSCKNKIIDNLQYTNPSIGGTQYLFLLLYQMLFDQFGKDIVLFSDTNIRFSDNKYEVNIVKDIDEVLDFCLNNNIPRVIIREQEIKKVDLIRYNRIQFYLWAHNTVDRKTDIISSKNDNIIRIVCVSKQQYENMGSYLCHKKAIYVNNCIPVQEYDFDDSDAKNAMYIGAIVPQKGCFELLRIWNRVKRKNDTSKLYIVGSASVRGLDRLGPKGIAEKRYEKKLMKLYHKNADSIVFCGSLPKQQIYEISKDCCVGIPNPSHYMRDETFCLSAVEMQNYGLFVVSRLRYDGLIDTVSNSPAGYLFKKDKEIANKVNEILNNSKKSHKAVDFSKLFSPNKFIKKWIEILSDENISTPISKSGKSRIREYYLVFLDFMKSKLSRII